MRICLLGEYSPTLDEGMKNVTFYLTRELSKYHQILPLDLRQTFSRAFWKDIKNFDPQIIHYIHGPTIKSFILLKALSVYCPKAKTVMSAMRPFFPSLLRRLISIVKPNLILTQSSETEEVFKRFGFKVQFLPCGVDTERFVPATITAKQKLKEKYEIDRGKFVILHIGSVKKGRNVQFLEKLQGGDNQVIIIGSTSTGVDRKIQQQLVKSECLLWASYFGSIDEIYALSDCYVFPVVPKKDLLGRATSDSIEMPLSVLEAMSCNLPVISTKFGALPRVFEEGDGLIFSDNEKDFLSGVEKIKNGMQVRNREKVLSYSWEDIAQQLQQIYGNIIFQPAGGESNER